LSERQIEYELWMWNENARGALRAKRRHRRYLALIQVRTLLATSLTAIVAVLGTVGITTVIDEDNPEFKVASIEGRMEVADELVLVNVFVVIPPGGDERERTTAALEAVAPGAIEIREDDLQSDDFTTTGLVWQDMPVVVQYNPAGSPVDGQRALLSAMATWTDSPSDFTWAFGGTTTRCPSLVDECPGAQFFDSFNDIGWLDISRAGVLGVTWSSPGAQEMDIVIDNTDYVWHTGGTSVPFGQFDLESIELHELGHGLGLGHSTSTAAVMYPSASSGRAKRSLHSDDDNGLLSLYPAGSPTPVAQTNTPVPTRPPATVTSIPPTPTRTPTAAVATSTSTQIPTLVPPTATRTRTPTVLPPTPTRTRTSTPVPATVTRTAVPPTATNTTSVPSDPEIVIVAPEPGSTVSGTMVFLVSSTQPDQIQRVRFWLLESGASSASYLGFDRDAPFKMFVDTTALANGETRLFVQMSYFNDPYDFISFTVTVANGVATATPTTVPPTVTFTAVPPTPIPTATPTPVPTRTPTPTQSPTPTRTLVPTATATETPCGS
jgi:hypothetical protein